MSTFGFDTEEKVLSYHGPLLYEANVIDRTVRQALEIVRRRIDEVGTREPTIQRQGADRILIQVPGIGSAAELKEIMFSEIACRLKSSV